MILKCSLYLGHTNVAELLIQRGADITDKTNDGYNSLHLAAANGKRLK